MIILEIFKNALHRINLENGIKIMKKTKSTFYILGQRDKFVSPI